MCLLYYYQHLSTTTTEVRLCMDATTEVRSIATYSMRKILYSRSFPATAPLWCWMERRDTVSAADRINSPISPLKTHWFGALFHMEALLQHVFCVWHFWMKRRDTVSAADCTGSRISPLNHPLLGALFHMETQTRVMSPDVGVIRGD